MIEEESDQQREYEEYQFQQNGQKQLLKNQIKYEHQPKRLVRPKKTHAQKKKNQNRRKEQIEAKIYKTIIKEADQNALPNTANLGSTVKSEIQVICGIVKYMLGEFGLENKTEYENPDLRTCQKWEVDEIIKQVSDTNLGDFIIKCPNPDNLPAEWMDKYNIKEVDGQLTSDYKMINVSQAMEFFYDLFDIEGSSKLEAERQDVAFLISFFFLKYKSSFQEKDIDAVIADSILKVYSFYKMIQQKNLKEYLQLRQEEAFQEKHQYIIQEMFPDQFQSLDCFGDGVSVEQYHEQIWKNLKNMIYKNLSKEVIENFGDGQKEQTQECKVLFGKAKSISELLLTFPELIEKVLNKAKAFQQMKEEQPEDEQKQKLNRKEKDQNGSNNQNKSDKKQKKTGEQGQIPVQSTFKQKQQSKKDYGKRLLFGGQYLKKTIVGQNVIWINTKGRPNDVATLLRFCLIYKLVIKSKLFVRMFLNRDETHIMLVVKSSEQILQNYAQKNKILMEVELGASDLFSFQPVDEYMRPLRKHKYVNDPEFIKKYNIKKGGGGDQNKQEMLSIQSESINIYQKAQLMNEDQLRSLIMKEQFAVDQLYEWVGKKLEINYISQKVLNNDYNKDNTDRQTWQLYYVYNKLINAFIKRVKALYTVSKKAKSYYAELDGNVGMILRLMFKKAIYMCNQMFYEYREERSFCPRVISNLWTQKTKLKNIWDHLEIQKPSGFCTYYKMNKMEKLWRKFQINQLKVRSKFFPSERLIIANRVIQNSINMSISLQKKHIIDFYPLHDPYILKSIQIEPYLSVVRSIKKVPNNVPQEIDGSAVNKLYSQYQCDATVQDFIKKSVQTQLQFKFFSFKTFQTTCIRSYCGQKIAFYFVLIKFLALKAWPLMLPAFIIQCLLWSQNSDILKYGKSSLTEFNNVLVFIWTFVNLFWTTHLIQSWKYQQRELAQQYGVSTLKQNQVKRVKFKGSFKRDFETDQLNYEYVPGWKKLLKSIFTLIINIAYLGLVTEVILLLFVFKTYLYQSGYSQTIVQQGPTIMIAVAIQIFTKVYTLLIRNIINFENHKTVSEYEGSLVSKVALITFVINFYSIFIYAYFSGYLGASDICQIKTSVTNLKINNCDYFVSSQLLSVIMVDFAMTIVGGMLPYIIFKGKQWWESQSTVKTSKFNSSYFESIDKFYEEQDKLSTYMYNEQLDSSWLGYMNIVNVFAATALFAPSLPFAYVMMFLTGLVRLHASKFDVIYLKKRILPTKTNSINWWLIILQAISYISIITNIAYMIYTRNIFTNYQAKLFFLFVIIFFAVKYFVLAQYNSGIDIMAKRNQIKTNDILTGRGREQFLNVPEQVNTDIQNVIYDQTKLKRKFHNVKGPNIIDNFGNQGQNAQKQKVE